MQCPVCKVDLNMSERHGVEIDYCPKCRGVWLDRGELDKIIDKATEPMVQPEPDMPDMPRAPDPQLWQDPYRGPQHGRRVDDGRHRAPDRRAQRDDDRDGHDRNWRAKDRDRDHDERDERDRDDRYRGGSYRRKRRRKSILSEIFDFD